MSPFSPRYSHRPNPDGTYDSICTTCTLTVAKGLNEAALAEPESLHKCQGLPLYIRWNGPDR
jgi:hypothetical protein